MPDAGPATSPPGPPPAIGTLTEEQATTLADTLKPFNVRLYFYTYPQFYLELKEKALDADGRLAPEVIAALKQCNAPKTTIDFEGRVNEITDATMEQLAEFPTVVKASFDRTERVTDAGLAALIKCQELKIVRFGGYGKQQMTETGLAELAKLPQLEELLITFRTKGSYLSAFDKHPRLKTLNVGSDDLADEELAKLTSLPQLETLDLTNCKVTGAGLGFLNGSKTLKVLNLSGNPNLLDAELAKITELPALEGINFGYSTLTGEGLGLLKSAKQLKSVHFSNCNKVTDAALAHLANLPEVTHFTVSGDPSLITDAGLAHIGTLSKLELLALRNLPQVTDAGIAELSKLQELKRLELQKLPQITDASFAAIGKCQALEVAEIEVCPKLTDAGLPQLKSLPVLRGLHFRDIPTITEPALEQLKTDMPKLMYVSSKKRDN